MSHSVWQAEVCSSVPEHARASGQFEMMTKGRG